MALINRITRLFRADMHAVLDRIEEPEALLRQAVREMEEDIDNDERSLKLLHNEQVQLEDRQSDIEESLTRLEDELDICFESQKDDLARSLIRRKLEAQRLQSFIVRKRETLSPATSELKQRLQENRTRLSAMRQKLELLTDVDTNAKADDSWSAPDVTVRDDEVEVAWLRAKQQRMSS